MSDPLQMFIPLRKADAVRRLIYGYATAELPDRSGEICDYPLPYVPTSGDAFTAAQGCDHTMATCSAKFNNLPNFRGYPFVPPPQVMTGPLSANWNKGQGKGK